MIRKYLYKLLVWIAGYPLAEHEKAVREAMEKTQQVINLENEISRVKGTEPVNPVPQGVVLPDYAKDFVPQ